MKYIPLKYIALICTVIGWAAICAASVVSSTADSAPAKSLPVVTLKMGQTQVLVRESIASVVSEDPSIVEVMQRSANLVTLQPKAAGETKVRLRWKNRDETFIVKVAGADDKRPVAPVNPHNGFEKRGLEARDASSTSDLTEGKAATTAPVAEKKEEPPVTAAPAAAPPVLAPPSVVSNGRPALWMNLRLSAQPGTTGLLEVTATFGNRGEGKATQVLVRDVLPPELEFVEGSARPPARFDAKTRELTWEAGELLPPAATVTRQQTASFQARVQAGHVGKVANIATIECAELDSIVASNTAVWSAQTPALLAVFAMPDAMLTKRNFKVPMLDVRGDEYQAAVDRLEGLGVVGGVPGRAFHPDRSITRAESVKMVVLGVDLKDTRDSTRISYALAREALVTVIIKNEANAVMRTLVKAQKKGVGEHPLTWDGRSDSGDFVPAGKYRFETRAIDNAGVTNTLTGTLTIAEIASHSYCELASFTDVKPGDWFAGIVGEAERRQYVNGYPDKSFRPRNSLTRAEATAIVVRALGLEAEARKRGEDDAGFSDVKDVPRWARGYVNVAATAAPKAGGELIIGYPGNTFMPQVSLKRKEAAAIIGRLIDKETKRQSFVTGMVSPGVTISINGKAITGAADGKFREAVDLIPGEVTPIAIVSR